MDFILLAARAPWNYLLGISLSVLALFLILLILVQRGRGGGLAGALGGMGGQSAFGTKAGDLFTRVTIGVAAVWILLCMLSIKVLNPSAGKPVFDRTDKSLPLDPKAKGVDKDKAKKNLESEPGGLKPDDKTEATTPDTDKPAAKPEADEPEKNSSDH